MAKTSPAQFIRDKIVRLRALLDGDGDILFQKVQRAVSIDGDRILKIPAFPSAVLTQLGGELNDANGEIWTRRMGVTVVVKSAWDPFGDRAAEQLDDLCDDVINELQDDQRDEGIICIYESEDDSVISENHKTDYAYRTLVFQYKIDRTTS